MVIPCVASEARSPSWPSLPRHASPGRSVFRITSPIANATLTLIAQISSSLAPRPPEMRVFTNESRMANRISGAANALSSRITSTENWPRSALENDHPRTYGLLPNCHPSSTPTSTPASTRKYSGTAKKRAMMPHCVLRASMPRDCTPPRLIAQVAGWRSANGAFDALMPRRGSGRLSAGSHQAEGVGSLFRRSSLLSVLPLWAKKTPDPLCADYSPRNGPLSGRARLTNASRFEWSNGASHRRRGGHRPRHRRETTGQSRRRGHRRY